MKTIILAVILLSFTLGGLVAKPVFGLRAGLNVSSMGGITNVLNKHAVVGIHAGGMLQYKFQERILFQPELLYSTKGYATDHANHHYVYHHNYIELPLLVKLNYEGNGVKIQPYMGPGLALAVASSRREDGSGTITIYDHTNYLELEWNFGIDGVFAENIMLGLRYNYGLSKVHDHSSIYYINGFDKNRVLMLNFGFLFSSN